MPGTMTISPAHVLAQAFIDLNLAEPPAEDLADLSTPWQCYAVAKVDKPDDLIVVYNTAGRGSGRTNPDGEMQGHRGIQVMVRSGDEERGWAKANELAQAMAKDIYRQVVTIDMIQYRIHCLAKVGDPLGFKEPDSKRRLFTVNALISVRQL